MQDELLLSVNTPSAPGSDRTIQVSARVLYGWTSIRVTRGAERLPNDFSITTTERYPAQRAANIVQPLDECRVFIGDDLLITGYVDTVTSSLDNGQHSVTVTGRGKCQDLVDCSAEWPGNLVNGTNALDIAQKLSAPYGITVTLDSAADPGPDVLSFPLNFGESAWDIIDRVARAAGLLVYETAAGGLYLSRVGSAEVGSDFRQGVNVQAASSTFDGSQRYSEYVAVAQSVDTLIEAGEGGFQREFLTDAGVIRHRRKTIVAETIGGAVSFDFVKARVAWEMNRRNGRSRSVRLVTDSWRDAAGKLYEPNTLAHVAIPLLKINTALEQDGQKWVIGEVTYSRDLSSGTICDLTFMPQSAYAVLPRPLIVPPPDVLTVAPR